MQTGKGLIDSKYPTAAAQSGQLSVEQLITVLPAAVYTCDLDGCILLFNPAAEKLWGKAPLPGTDMCYLFEKLFHGTGKPVAREEHPVMECIQASCKDQREFQLLRPDDSKRWIKMHPDTLKDATGNVIGAINMLLDITDSKIAEEKTAILASIVYSSEDAILSKTLDGIIMSWNSGAERLFGYREEEMIGQPVTRLIPPDRLEEEPTILEHIRRGERVEHFDTKRLTKSNQLIDISLTISPVKDLQGNIIGASKIARDITMQKRLYKALQESERKFSALVMQSPVAILILKGSDFIVEIANAAYLELSGIRKMSFIGRPLLEVIPAAEVAETRRILEDVFRNKTPHYQNEFPLEVKDGDGYKKMYYNLVFQPLEETGGSMERLMIIASNITDLVISKQALGDSQTQFSNMVMQSPVPMTIIRGSDHIIEIANTQMLQKIWRKDSSGVIGKKLLDIFPELRNQKYAQLLAYVYQNGIAHRETEAEFFFHGEDGIRQFYLDYEYAPLFDMGGAVSGVMVTLNDVTEKVEARQLLEDAEQRSRLAIEAAEMGTFDWNLATGLFVGSPRLGEIFGLPAEASINHHHLVNSIYPEDKPIRDEAVAQARERGSLSYEARIIWPDKSTHSIKVYGKIVYEGRKNPLRMYGTVLDITEERATLVALEQSEQRLSVALEAAELGTWEVNLLNGETRYSPKYQEIFGFGPEENPGHDELLERTVAEDLVVREKAFNEAILSGILNFEMRINAVAGSFTWIQVKGKVFYGVQGMPQRIMGTIMDITPAKTAYQTLQESEERFRTIANTAPVMIWMSGNDQFTDFFNTSWLNFTGKSAEQEKGDGWLDNVHPEDVAAVAANYRSAFAAQRKFHIEYRLRRFDGQYRWIGDSAVPRADTSGKFIGFISACMDIHDQKEFSEAMVESEERFRLLANFMPQFVWTANANGVFTYFNLAVSIYSGLNAEALYATGWSMLLHPEDRNQSDAKWQEAIQSGNDFNFEHRFRRKDGGYRWQLSRALPQKDQNGDIQMWIGTSTDIQDIKEHEQQKDDFIGMASHELKTPITSIKGYIQLLLQMTSNGGNPMIQSSLNTIDKQVSRLTQLIRDLLDLTKINSGGFRLRKESVDLYGLTEEVMIDMQHTTITHRMRLESRGRGNYMVLADRDRISQVLINFITNAIKYSPAAAEVLVSVSSTGENVIVAVEDAGIGIALQDQDKIFERFYRVQGKEELTYPGFGIGLFIANDIIKKHNGEIWVKSEKNKGSVFYFSLPQLNNTNTA